VGAQHLFTEEVLLSETSDPKLEQLCNLEVKDAERAADINTAEINAETGFERACSKKVSDYLPPRMKLCS
jgi:hypothetical protein